METSLAAYHLLLAIARADGNLGEEERELIDHYRVALGLDASSCAADEEYSESLLEETGVWKNASPHERAHLFRMLVRVACAEDGLRRSERRILRRVAKAIGISRLEYASIVVSVEREMDRHHRSSGGIRRWGLAVGVGAIVVTLGLSWALKGYLHGPAEAAALLKRVEDRACTSLLLIQVDYELRHGTQKSRRRSTGTGFFVSSDGLIATNKHVLQPWKFSGEPARLVREGYTVDEPSVRIVAFPAGVQVTDQRGKRDTSKAYDSRTGALRIVAFAPDRMTVQRLQSRDGTRVETLLHDNDSADLALLRAEVTEPVDVLPLRRPTVRVETLEPVLVLGFPDGADLFERGCASPTVSVGEISKIEETLLINAPVVGGSSGGPVVDARGRVVGVVTRSMTGSTFSRCIQSGHVLTLGSAHGLTP